MSSHGVVGTTFVQSIPLSCNVVKHVRHADERIQDKKALSHVAVASVVFVVPEERLPSPHISCRDVGCGKDGIEVDEEVMAILDDVMTTMLLMMTVGSFISWIGLVLIVVVVVKIISYNMQDEEENVNFAQIFFATSFLRYDSANA